MKSKTQHSLALASGLHPSRISAIATGKADPRITEAWKIAEALQVPVTWLFEDHTADLGATV
ncbi:helix-turn-helix transcriptional regulator [Rothia similmucilaginosa]|uniref:helix-turn-helix transcriptional regulator n=1 Tax=Rothia sp. RSM42 TaxID=3030211 RepID=UPI002448A481|nr:helix-turn-helix transcriptional regulator [Rothia sp. RSM42]